MAIAHYILKNGRIKRVDFMTWARWFEHSYNERVISRTDVGPYTVSTVFLGLDHNFFGEGPAILFESIVFCGRRSTELQTRYATMGAAKKGHAYLVAEMRSRIRSKKKKAKGT